MKSLVRSEGYRPKLGSFTDTGKGWSADKYFMNLAQRHELAPEPPVTHADVETFRILLIDDDEGYRALCQRYLKRSDRADFDVVTVSTAAEGLQKLEGEEFDCLLVDYVLPDVCGTQVVRALRDLDTDQSPPTVILTADGGQNAAADAVRAGAMDFLPKRLVSPESLVRAILNAVHKSRLRRSVAAQSQKLQTANEQLKAKNEEIQRFYQVVSHEVKTPLAAAREFVAITLDGIAGPVTDYQKEMLTHALESCDQIKAQFNDLIEITRLESRKMVLNKELSSLNRVVTRCFASMQSAIEAKKIYVKKRILSEVPPFLFDSNRIVQVLSNLLGNAVKYTDPGGTITLAMNYDSDIDVVDIIVSDTGCGIGEGHLDQVFDRLYQVGSGDDSMGAGLGLGLSIAQEIVELHDGQLTVESELGKGSSFTVRLPGAKIEVQTKESEK